VGHEERLAGECALAYGHQFAHEATIGLGTITHFGLESDAIFHVVHGSCFGDNGLARIELDLNHLHALAEDGEVDLVRAFSFVGNLRG